MKKFFKKLWRSWNPQYILQVTHRGIDRRIHVVDFKKRSPKKLSGTNIDGEYFELTSLEPMDYYIQEYKDDLR